MNFNAVVVKNEKLAENIYLLRLKSEKISHNAAPGQFVNIKCCDGLDTYLRRPVSILRTHGPENTFDIAFMVRGKGTRILSCLKEGDAVDCIGPLGRGFTLPEKGERICVVGGGIGIFPLLYLLEKSAGAYKAAFLGFRSGGLVVLGKDFEKAADQLIISTDDGSFGEKGPVTTPFLKYLEKERPDRVYTCGPAPMMIKVADACNERGIFCEVSMEQRMGCGIGACLVCVCRIKHNDDWAYERICRDGPVFRAEEVIFE
ncbi:dihydroorotate dehydrogenase B (NAD(+)), electron transfer subunit PyrK [Thermoclostridium stercorarium subsp. stercorarium DSM 8532]|uniref:Dihydroorotate dehydrogenase B (NAD(+)), electron transfer subunit n=2 Tax=Thermoclostridium stercorarium TaxID=1510 RepID=L7VM20_THES1|nr:dihydroorotate dehydrogenase electron transfer subunit [Thermoclostridium stercorarium]AGC67659.1 dihydroorotate dehydrogenase B (NAD(+)), electron transfer subunit PyrK [Thermoclostridium stercorarium subsp. stercorarium DSM 8532]AGI38706.1 2-polyprenylphenol hydroxylase [Thermoclostridium stercorarium subsp. stercorarium DSM 8532]ANW98076.1 diguanylate cyclase [Thermoclostridium stercorarium subsp. thermolacticum DSM 2910]